MIKRTDYIENRIDVVKNVFKLYTYAKSTSEEEHQFVSTLFSQNKVNIVEKIGNQLFFSSMRFARYLNNTMEKYKEDAGHGTPLKRLYEECNDDFISLNFKSFIRSLDIPPSHTFIIPKTHNIANLKSNSECFFISPTHCNGDKPTAWDSFLENNLMAIGFANKDYSNSTIDEINEEYKDSKGARKARKALGYMKEIKYGDIICCTNNNSGLWGIGVALSSYKFKENIHYAGVDKDGNDSYYSHYIDVAWLKYNSDSYIKKEDFNIEYPEIGWEPYGALSKKAIPKYIENYLFNTTSEKITAPMNNIDKYITLLENCKNLILTGAPGTGKTHLADQIANTLINKCDFNTVDITKITYYDINLLPIGITIESSKSRSEYQIDKIENGKVYISGSTIKDGEIPFKGIIDAYNDKLWEGGQRNGLDPYNAAIAKYIYDDKKNNPYRAINATDQITRVQFHPSYDYTDFVEGLRPTKPDNNGNIGFELKDGIFKSFCKRAIKRESEKVPFVFIIDEINRGEVSKILGELFFSIDPGYRGEKGKVKTQYDNLIAEDDVFKGGFYIPENVYIIGTMNDIDRNVESMDFAFRRRFAWNEIKVEETLDEIISNIERKELISEAKERLCKLNEKIKEDDTLGDAYCIGGAYLLKINTFKDVNEKEDVFKMLWDYHLENVVYEYFRGLPCKEITEKMEIMKGVFDNIEE